MPNHFTAFDALSILIWFFSFGVLGVAIWSLRRRVSKIAILPGILIAVASLFEMAMATYYFSPTAETINTDFVRLMIIVSAAILSLLGGLIITFALALKRG